VVDKAVSDFDHIAHRVRLLHLVRGFFPTHIGLDSVVGKICIEGGGKCGAPQNVEKILTELAR